MLDAATPERLGKLVKRLLDRAMRGDVGAAKLVLSYTVGPPLETSHPDDLDMKEWHKITQLPSSLCFGGGNRVSLEFALALTQGLVAYQEKALANEWVGRLGAGPHVAKALEETGWAEVLKQATARTRKGS
jgi:hypothetical protein